MLTHLSNRSMLVTVLTMTIATSSCGGGSGGGSSAGGGTAASPPPSAAPIVVPRAVEQTDLQIAQLIYAGEPRTPEGFYRDSAPSGHAYVATAHLKNSDLQPTETSDPIHELCTNDWNEALDWSETHAQSAQSYADLVATNDDARYFEFGRVRAGEPELYVRDRVFKCAYVDRSAANLREGEGAAGQLNLRPLTAPELQTLSEYLWQFTPYNNFGNAVLKSSGTSNASTLGHTLHIGSLVRNGISSTCDRIDILAWRHAVDTSTGALTLDIETLFGFGARESNGLVELCSQ